MCRFAAQSLFAVFFGVAWCALAAQFSAANPPAVYNPFGAGPSAAVAQDNPFDVSPSTEVSKGNPIDAAPKAAAAKDAPFAPAPDAAKPFAPMPGAQSTDATTAMSETKIRQALERPTTIDFVETPLQDAIDYLGDSHDIDIQLDTRALEDAGIGRDTPVTRHLKENTLASVLRILLSGIDSTFVIRDGVLLITTQDAAREMVNLRVYEIGDLVQSDTDVNELAEVLRALFAGGPVTRTRTSDHAEVNTGTMATIRRTGGACFSVLPYRNLLIVQASQHDHAALAQLLGEIKAKLKTD